MDSKKEVQQSGKVRNQAQQEQCKPWICGIASALVFCMFNFFAAYTYADVSHKDVKPELPQKTESTWTQTRSDSGGTYYTNSSGATAYVYNGTTANRATGQADTYAYQAPGTTDWQYVNNGVATHTWQNQGQSWQMTTPRSDNSIVDYSSVQVTDHRAIGVDTLADDYDTRAVSPALQAYIESAPTRDSQLQRLQEARDDPGKFSANKFDVNLISHKLDLDQTIDTVQTNIAQGDRQDASHFITEALGLENSSYSGVRQLSGHVGQLGDATLPDATGLVRTAATGYENPTLPQLDKVVMTALHYDDPTLGQLTDALQAGSASHYVNPTLAQFDKVLTTGLSYQDPTLYAMTLVLNAGNAANYVNPTLTQLNEVLTTGLSYPDENLKTVFFVLNSGGASNYVNPTLTQFNKILTTGLSYSDPDLRAMAFALRAGDASNYVNPTLTQFNKILTTGLSYTNIRLWDITSVLNAGNATNYVNPTLAQFDKVLTTGLSYQNSNLTDMALTLKAGSSANYVNPTLTQFNKVLTTGLSYQDHSLANMASALTAGSASHYVNPTLTQFNKALITGLSYQDHSLANMTSLLNAGNAANYVNPTLTQFNKVLTTGLSYQDHSLANMTSALTAGSASHYVNPTLTQFNKALITGLSYQDHSLANMTLTLNAGGVSNYVNPTLTQFNKILTTGLRYQDPTLYDVATAFRAGGGYVTPTLTQLNKVLNTGLSYQNHNLASMVTVLRVGDQEEYFNPTLRQLDKVLTTGLNYKNPQLYEMVSVLQSGNGTHYHHATLFDLNEAFSTGSHYQNPTLTGFKQALLAGDDAHSVRPTLSDFDKVLTTGLNNPNLTLTDMVAQIKSVSISSEKVSLAELNFKLENFVMGNNNTEKGLSMPVLNLQGATDRDVALVKNEIAKIPAEDARILQSKDVYVVVIRGKISEYDPSKIDEQPRGRPQGATYDADVPGYYSPSQQKIVIVVDDINSKTGDGSLQEGLVLHESGHAVADTTGEEKKDDFKLAYESDREYLGIYFRQGEGIGIEETFAEWYANYYDGKNINALGRAGGPELSKYFSDREAARAERDNWIYPKHEIMQGISHELRNPNQ